METLSVRLYTYSTRRWTTHDIPGGIKLVACDRESEQAALGEMITSLGDATCAHCGQQHRDNAAEALSTAYQAHRVVCTASPSRVLYVAVQTCRGWAPCERGGVERLKVEFDRIATAMAALSACAPRWNCVACLRTQRADEPDFMRCSGCKIVRYCGVDCQRAHWPKHRDMCRAPRE